MSHKRLELNFTWRGYLSAQAEDGLLVRSFFFPQQDLIRQSSELRLNRVARLANGASSTGCVQMAGADAMSIFQIFSAEALLTSLESAPKTLQTSPMQL